MVDASLKKEIERLVDDLVGERYAAIAADGRAGRCSVDDLQRRVHEYGRKLIALSTDSWTTVEPVPRADGALAIDVDLWTAEQGRSDLTLSLTATKTDGTWKIEIDDLRVL